MKTITIIIAVLLIFVGTLLLISALHSSGWDFSKLGTQNLVTNSYDITHDFSVISIETVTADVENATPYAQKPKRQDIQLTCATEL